MKEKKLFFYILLLFIYFILGACTPSVVIMPKELPQAVLGRPYYAEIDIREGSGPISPASFIYKINPDRTLWIEVNHKKDVGYNSLIIHGIPKTTEDIVVNIQGDMIPTTLFSNGSEFKKTYIIKVKQQ